MTDINEKNREIRTMAQDAELDKDVESMVPPTWGSRTNLIMIVLLCVVVVAGIVIAAVSA